MPATAQEETIRLLNLREQYAVLKEEIHAAIQGVMESQHFILGPNVTALEAEIARYCGRRHAVGVASGTDALILALKAAGVGRGDEVIVPASSFIATADSVSLLGATPVFVDIDPLTFNLDPEAVRRKVTARTRAIIPVHLYGQPAEMLEIGVLAQEHGLAVVGDAAQALGSTYAGEPVCSYGEFGCISFFPSKNLGACGDAGMIVTDDADAADELRKLRSHGSRKKYYSEIQGWNSRLDELQAAILRVKLPYLDGWNETRRQVAALYDAYLGGVEGLITPRVAEGRTHVFHQYTIRVPQRDKVQAALAREGIESAVYYPVPLHLQTMYGELDYGRGDFPNAEAAAEEVLSLPIYPELGEAQVERIAGVVREAVQGGTA